MKKIMRGVLLFGMLGGMLLSCGNKKGNDSQEQKKDSKVSEKVSKEAVNQIVEKKYDVALKDRGIEDITLVGVAFCGKMVKVFYS